MKASRPIMCMLAMQSISVRPFTALRSPNSPIPTTPDTNPSSPSTNLSLFIKDTRTKYSHFSLAEILNTIEAETKALEQSHLAQVTVLNATHTEKVAEQEDTCNTILHTTKAFYTDTIAVLNSTCTAELSDVRNQLDRVQKRTGKLKSDLKTIAENRARSDRIKRETDAILKGYLASNAREDWSELWE